MMRPALAPLLVLLVPSLCLAWGGEAHQLVALIAEDHLTPTARAAVTELLDDGNISDAEVANWADEIRRQRSNTVPWHYVTIPHDVADFDAERDGRKGANVINAIERQAKLLADKPQPREKRVEALKCVVHFIGDVHQPLHCVDRNGDRGGNGRLVYLAGRKGADSLHYVWDTALVRHLVGRRKIAEVADAVGRTITAKQRKGSPEAWANESHRAAVDRVYANMADGGDPPRLRPEYAKASTPVVAEQINRAGVRLAAVLNAALR
jgi:hypothetical protein